MKKEQSKAKKESVCCPFCDVELAESSLPFCQACKVKVFFCPECRKPVSREDKTCPNCGETLGKK